MQLADLSNKALGNFPGDEEISKEIIACRGLKGGARKRQIKYLAKVLRQYPMDDIYEYLTKIKGSDLKEKQKFHEAERLRDALVNDAMESFQLCQKEQTTWEPDWHSDILEQTTEMYPEAKENDLRKTIYQYVKSRNSLHYRELFRMLKATIELQERKKKEF